MSNRPPNNKKSPAKNTPLPGTRIRLPPTHVLLVPATEKKVLPPIFNESKSLLGPAFTYQKFISGVKKDFFVIPMIMTITGLSLKFRLVNGGVFDYKLLTSDEVLRHRTAKIFPILIQPQHENAREPLLAEVVRIQSPKVLPLRYKGLVRFSKFINI